MEAQDIYVANMWSAAGQRVFGAKETFTKATLGNIRAPFTAHTARGNSPVSKSGKREVFRT